MTLFIIGGFYEYMCDTKDDASHRLIDASSGRGALPLIPKTIARELVIKELIGQGRYGKVYKALRGDDFVAVKVSLRLQAVNSKCFMQIFFTWEEASWRRESDIYQTVMLHHDYILSKRY